MMRIVAQCGCEPEKTGADGYEMAFQTASGIDGLAEVTGAVSSPS